MARYASTRGSCTFLDPSAIITSSDPHHAASTPTVSLPTCCPHDVTQIPPSSRPIISDARQSAKDAGFDSAIDNNKVTSAIRGRIDHVHRRIRRQPRWIARQLVDASDVEALWVLSAERLTSKEPAIVKLPRKTTARI